MPEAAPVAPAPVVAPAVAKPVVPAPVAPKTAPAAETKPAGITDAHEVVINGKKVTKTIAELIRDSSKVGHASGIAQQAKEALKTIREREAKLKEQESIWDDDARLEAELEKRGKLDALARKRLEKKVNEAQLTPEQQERDAAKAERDALAAKLAEREEADKKVQQAQLQERAQAYIQTELKAAAGRAGLTIDVDSFDAIHDVLSEFVRLRLPFDADQIIATAQENIDGGFKRLEQSVLKGMKGQALVDRLGPEVVKEVLRFRTEQLRNGGGRVAPPAPKPAAPAEEARPNLQDLMNKYRGGA